MQERSLALIKNALINAFNEIENNKNLPTLYRKDDLVNDIINFLSAGEYPNPDDVFDYLDKGSYKECYELPYNDNYIMKFSTENNDTTSEQGILAAAKSAGLDEIFIPTYFIPLYDIRVSLPYIAEDSGYGYNTFDSKNDTFIWVNDDGVNVLSDFIIIQPRIDGIVAHSYDTDGDYSFNISEDRPHYKPLINSETGEIISPNRIRNISVNNYYWMEKFVVNYCDLIDKFNAFCAKYCITDLHNYNIGFLNEKPIIIDWLSKRVSVEGDNYD